MTDTSTPEGYYSRFRTAPNTLSIRVPREEALAWGHVEPTAEEIAAARDRVPERYAEQVTAWTATKAFLAAVAAADLPPLVRAVLDLHHRAGDHDYASCVECAACCGTHGEWPCGTARLLIEDAGITVPEDLVFETPVLPLPDPDNPRWPYPAGPVTWGSLFPLVTIRDDGIRFDTPKVTPSDD